jgi:protein-S-isoprenylcysteine O-methyltransferase Ste14
VAFDLTLAGWVLLELGIRVRERVRGRGGTGHDRFTRVLVGVSIGATIGLAAASASHVKSLAMPEPFRVAGLIVMWVGLAARGWAIATLGSAFRTTVEVDPGQAVVSTGPYKRVRHPSYAGLLLILAGFGLAIGNWLALATCLMLPVPSVLRRITVEEAELTRVLGDPYHRYQRRTRRLIPGLW